MAPRPPLQEDRREGQDEGGEAGGRAGHGGVSRRRLPAGMGQPYRPTRRTTFKSAPALEPAAEPAPERPKSSLRPVSENRLTNSGMVTSLTRLPRRLPPPPRRVTHRQLPSAGPELGVQ